MFSGGKLRAIPYLSAKISVAFAQKSSVFPDGNAALFGHTTGGGWNQTNDNCIDE